MKVFYINLDNAINRRKSLESSFARSGEKNWELERFSAFDIGFVKNLNKINAKESHANIACSLSHKGCIEKNINSKEPFFIIEDDTEIGKDTYKILVEILDNFKKNNFEWDILFTDVVIPQVRDMLELFIQRNDLITKKQYKILDLKTIRFAGLSAYTINPKSIKKILELINNEEIFNIPIDIYIKKLIQLKKIKGFSIFPFITSLSLESVNSQISANEHANTVLAWNIFRMLIWNESNIDKISSLIKKMDKVQQDQYYKSFGPIFTYLLSKKFF